MLKVRNEHNKKSQNYSREAISFSDLVLSTICFRKKKKKKFYKRCSQTIIWHMDTENRMIDNLEEFSQKKKSKQHPRLVTNGKW